MAEPHVITALRAKRAEISGHVADLERKLARHRANLANIDATIRLFALRPRQYPAETDLSADAVFCQGRTIAARPVRVAPSQRQAHDDGRHRTRRYGTKPGHSRVRG
jgi:hypothetical protein